MIARDWRGLLFNCLGRLLETPTWSVKYLPSNWGVRQTLTEGLRVFCREVVLLQLVLHCDWTVLLLQTKSWTLVCGHVRNSRELVESVCLSHWTTGVFNFTHWAVPEVQLLPPVFRSNSKVSNKRLFFEKFLSQDVIFTNPCRLVVGILV